MTISMYARSKLGQIHPEPCPDCGGALVLVEEEGRVIYRCEMQGCNGNSGASQATGRPEGIPINKEGRWKRVRLHEMIDKFWKLPGDDPEERSQLRSLVYQFMQLSMVDVPDFHVKNLNHAQLDRAIDIATNVLPRYMEGWGITLDQEAHTYVNSNFYVRKRPALQPGNGVLRGTHSRRGKSNGSVNSPTLRHVHDRGRKEVSKG